MVTTEFKKNAYEGYDEAQNTLETGNAFATGQMKRETINALQNAMMNGAEDSSIATAAMKLSGHFKSSASKRDDKKDKGLSMGEMALLQQVNDMLAIIDDMLIDTREEISELEAMYEDFKDGKFDPLNNDKHQEQLEKYGLTVEEWQIMSLPEQGAWLENQILNRREMEAALENGREKVAAGNFEDFENNGGEKTTIYMTDVQNLLEDRGQTVDPDNISFQDRVNMAVAMGDVSYKNDNEERELSNLANANSAVEAKIDDFF